MFSSLKWFKNENLTYIIILFYPHDSEVNSENIKKYLILLYFEGVIVILVTHWKQWLRELNLSICNWCWSTSRFFKKKIFNVFRNTSWGFFTPVNEQKMFRRKIRKSNFISNSTVKEILVMINPEQSSN